MESAAKIEGFHIFVSAEKHRAVCRGTNAAIAGNIQIVQISILLHPCFYGAVSVLRYIPGVF